CAPLPSGETRTAARRAAAPVPRRPRTGWYRKPAPPARQPPARSAASRRVSATHPFKFLETSPTASGLVHLEMAASGSDGFGLIRLPGSDGDVGDTATLTPHLAGSEGGPIKTGTTIIYRQVDDCGQMWTAHEHQQMQHRRVFHEAGDDPAMQRRQGGIADVVLVAGQAEHHLVTQAQALDTDQPGVGHHLQQRIVVVAFMDLAHPFVEISVTHLDAPRSPVTTPLPMRMKAPTTWAMGSLMSR